MAGPKRKQEDDRECEGHSESHTLVDVRGVGCSKETATANLLHKLIMQVLSERKIKCEDRECSGLDEGACKTAIDPYNWERISKEIKFSPIPREGCPEDIGWLTTLTPKIKKFTSLCQCVPVIWR